MPAHCLPDKLTLALSAGYGGLQAHPEDGFRRALSGSPYFKGTSGRTLRLKVPADGGKAAVRAKLDVWGSPGGELFFDSASTVELNGLRLLRASLGGEAAGPMGLDGKDNVVGELDGRETQLLTQVLSAIGEAFDTLVGVLEEALPRPGPQEVETREPKLWLKSAEACADIALPDALRLARALRWAPAPGTLEVRSAAYTGVSVTPAGGWPTTTWKRGRGVLWKAYAKRPDLLRCEVTCRSRSAVVSRTGPQVAQIDGAGAVALVKDFLAAVDADVAALARHVRTVEAGGASRADLVDALDPLYRLARPAPGAAPAPGGRPRSETLAKAWEAYDGLLDSGWCRPKGLSTKGKLRVILEQLAGPGGPLARQGHEAIYCLAPHFALAFATPTTEADLREAASNGVIAGRPRRPPERRRKGAGPKEDPGAPSNEEDL